MEEKDPEALRRRESPETGPYVLRTLLQELPLSAEGNRDHIEINCVEVLGTFIGPELQCRAPLPSLVVKE